MKTLIVCGCAVLVAVGVPAQNYQRAIQQANRASAQEGAEQQSVAREAGGGGNSGSSAPAAPAPAPVNPALQATLSNISSLQADFAAVINSTSDKPDPAQKVSLLTNLANAAQGTKATSDLVKKLADDLATAVLGQKKLVAAEQTKLARSVHALFNSSHLTDAQQQGLLAAVQKTLTDGGVSLDLAVDVVTDLKQVVSETK